MEIKFEEVEDQQFSNPIAYVFEENIGLTDLCVSFKINIPNMDEDEQIRLVQKLILYMKSHAELICYTQGIHTEGKRQIPHIHLHFIINSSTGWSKVMTNASQHRKRWFAKEGYEYPDSKVIEMKCQAVDQTQPKYHFLAYPMKEGKYLKRATMFEFLNAPMTTEMRNFLVDYGKSLYNLKVAHDLANDRCEERKELKYSEILLCAKSFTGTTFREFQIHMEASYIQKIIDKGDNVPDIDNYKKNLKRAAVQLKFFKTYEV